MRVKRLLLRKTKKGDKEKEQQNRGIRRGNKQSK